MSITFLPDLELYLVHAHHFHFLICYGKLEREKVHCHVKQTTPNKNGSNRSAKKLKCGSVWMNHGVFMFTLLDPSGKHFGKFKLYLIHR